MANIGKNMNKLAIKQQKISKIGKIGKKIAKTGEFFVNKRPEIRKCMKKPLNFQF